MCGLVKFFGRRRSIYISVIINDRDVIPKSGGFHSSEAYGGGWKGLWRG